MVPVPSICGHLAEIQVAIATPPIIQQLLVKYIRDTGFTNWLQRLKWIRKILSAADFLVHWTDDHLSIWVFPVFLLNLSAVGLLVQFFIKSVPKNQQKNSCTQIYIPQTCRFWKHFHVKTTSKTPTCLSSQVPNGFRLWACWKMENRLMCGFELKKVATKFWPFEHSLGNEQVVAFECCWGILYLHVLKRKKELQIDYKQRRFNSTAFSLETPSWRWAISICFFFFWEESR